MLVKILEAEEYVTELILPHTNIRLYSFNNRTDLITDMNHYHDGRHYAAWINSMILRWLYDGKYRITPENYQDTLQKEYDFFTTFDYESINGQEDYAEDDYAAALLNEQEAKLPILAVSGSYYRWSDFRRYCLNKIDRYEKRRNKATTTKTK